jgi:hypothetical protein
LAAAAARAPLRFVLLASVSDRRMPQKVIVMSSPRVALNHPLAASIVCSIFALIPAIAAASVGFQPVSPDELKMTSEPKAPGAAAILLYREVDRDDRGNTAHEDVYFRIKILTEEGRKYADIEIPFFKSEGNVINVHARTIRTDGTVVNFSGQVFDKSIIKARGLRYMAKTLTLPEVEVGCVIEYVYTLDLAENFVFDSHWIISNELFTKHAKFSLKPYDGSHPPMNVRWSWSNLPAGTAAPAEGPDHVIRLEVNDVPAFQTEDYMPPENELKARVDFIYGEDAFEKDTDKFWRNRGKKLNSQLESFVGKRSAMEQAVAQIVSPTDSPEVKLRKIYDRVQQIRNTSYEAEKTEQEEKREKEKPLNNVEDVWKSQYGNGVQLTWLFLALARAAGFDASGMWVADRHNYFFNPQLMDAHRLDANVVTIKLDGKDLFFDPGAEFTPFGMLPWTETGVTGRKLSKDGGSWMQTALPASNDSEIRRNAELRVTDTGDLEGKLTLTYTGLEAEQRRVEERLSDPAERKKYLEDEVRAAIPAACDVQLTNQPDWKTSSSPLVAEFSLKVPGWVGGAGHRALLTVGLFSAPEKHLFDHADRVHPIYFAYPFLHDDDITIDLPLGWQISSVPSPEKQQGHIIGYTMQAKNENGTLHLTRTLTVDFLLLDVKYYGALRSFFQLVRTDDEQQVILQPGGSVHAGN